MTLAPEEFPETYRILNEGIADGVAPGMIAGLWRASEPGRLDIVALGNRRVIPSPQPMLADTLVDLASLSKIVATATLTGLLVDRGWLRWDTPLTSILPVAHFRGIEIRHLLSHSAGLVWWEPYWEKLRARFAPMPVWQISVGDRQRAMREFVCARAGPRAG